MFNLFSKPSAEQKITQLIEKYQEAVYWFIRRRVLNHDDAADIVQEVFIRAYKSIDKLKEDKAAKSWIFRIAANETTRFLESRHNSSTVELTEEHESTLMESEYVDFENDAAVKFQKALMELSDRQRQVFDLRYYQDMTYEEIAETLGGNVATMKTTYHIAKQKITDYILNN